MPSIRRGSQRAVPSSRLDTIIRYYREHPSESLFDLAKGLGMHSETLRRRLCDLKNEGKISEEEYRRLTRGTRKTICEPQRGARPEASASDTPSNAANARELAGHHISFSVSGNTAMLEGEGKSLCSLEELLRAAKVDQTVWEVERHVVNHWEVGAKIDTRDANGRVIETKIVKEPLWQVKAWLRRRVEVIDLLKLRDEILDSVRALARAPRVVPKATQHHAQQYMLEISIPDLQAGRLVWGKQTEGDNYDVDRACRLYLYAVQEILERTRSYPVNLILHVVGNDLLNADNAKLTTTAGTPQSEDSRRYRTKKLVFEMLCRALEMMSERAPVRTIMVPGNHDQESIFDLGMVLEAYFSRNSYVTVDNSPPLRKYFRYGVNLIGFTHGKNEPIKNLPLIMATERPYDWAHSTFREWHIAHFHKKKELDFLTAEEFNQVRVRVLPSLCALDEWTYQKGYRSHRSAEAYLWNAVEGYAGHISVNIPYVTAEKDGEAALETIAPGL